MAVANEKSFPDEGIQAIQDYVIDNYQEKLVGRQILARANVDSKKQTYKYYKISSEMINAQVIAPKGDFPREDLRDMTELTDTLKKIGLGYDISREDYQHDNWVNRSIREITHKVSLLEDDVIINGESTYGINGIADVSANTISAGNAWSDSANATPQSDLLDAIAKLQSQSNYRFGNDPSDLVLLMNPQNATELRKQFTSEDDERAMPYFDDLLGRVFTSPQVNEGYAYLQETGLDIARLVIAEDVTVESPQYDIEDQTYKGNIYARVLPVFLQYGSTAGESTAFVEIDSI